MSMRMVSLMVFALAAFIAFGDLLVSHSHSSPQTFLNDVGRSVADTITGVKEWFGLG